MLVIVGHGPSLLTKQRGAWLDEQTVVRLKGCPKPDPVFFGTRTDYQFVNKLGCPPQGCPVWGFAFMPNGVPRARNADRKRWMSYFETFNPSWFKPSSGLRAIFCAVEFLSPKQIGLVGFDKFMDATKNPNKWNQDPFDAPPGAKEHDYAAERKCAESLVELVEV
jgi:hypothetical protein